MKRLATFGVICILFFALIAGNNTCVKAEFNDTDNPEITDPNNG